MLVVYLNLRSPSAKLPLFQGWLSKQQGYKISSSLVRCVGVLFWITLSDLQVHPQNVRAVCVMFLCRHDETPFAFAFFFAISARHLRISVTN